jgi:hypothetical protein
MVWSREKSFAPVGNQTLVIQHTACRYTDWAPGSRILIGKPEKLSVGREGQYDRITIQFNTVGKLELNRFRIWLNHNFLLVQLNLVHKTKNNLNSNFKFLTHETLMDKTVFHDLLFSQTKNGLFWKVYTFWTQFKLFCNHQSSSTLVGSLYRKTENLNINNKTDKIFKSISWSQFTVSGIGRRKKQTYFIINWYSPLTSINKNRYT